MRIGILSPLSALSIPRCGIRMGRAAMCFLLVMSVTGCAQDAEPPPTLDPAHQAYLKAGDLEVIVRDNKPFGEMRAGLNGVALLRHRSEERNLFRSGLNLEHIFDGEKRREGPYEPRSAPMRLTTVSDRTVVLHQLPTPDHRLESRTTFTLTPPHYIDAPENLAIYTIGKGRDEPRWVSDKLRWIQHASGQHNDRSTLRYIDEARRPTFSEWHAPILYTGLAHQYYAYPFYYGRFEDMVYILMFDRAEGIRFSMSPHGAGRNPDGTTNPAWDWQWFIFDPQVGETYRYHGRVVYKPWVSKADVIAEYEAWSGRQVEWN